MISTKWGRYEKALELVLPLTDSAEYICVKEAGETGSGHIGLDAAPMLASSSVRVSILALDRNLRPVIYALDTD